MKMDSGLNAFGSQAHRQELWWSRVRLNACKGLLEDTKAQKLAFQHWIEAIDARHHYGHSLHIYFEERCKANAGQPFFYCIHYHFISIGEKNIGTTIS
ncbi:IQ domain-containing protein IQM3-like isoform X3 [Durio zibethinus]|uniref:IQ domain-containing protein IQM3-like isoform X3 n=1 Tax=Durio zibethinus TaxID=66656 RepID=A0A6P5WND3_DURZI|nr:IQ domain-containing protein IQM3-like isoform X3 [Durio zibethinus]XP_022717631.1 IQ domain-containing protein IQM3-like isoform X3 [Durio zibethinus]XP_022717632.1 IQ domain-containing protein IQM3-like isoform X3 [Durio zibethinus]